MAFCLSESVGSFHLQASTQLPPSISWGLGGVAVILFDPFLAPGDHIEAEEAILKLSSHAHRLEDDEWEIDFMRRLDEMSKKERGSESASVWPRRRRSRGHRDILAGSRSRQLSASGRQKGFGTSVWVVGPRNFAKNIT